MAKYRPVDIRLWHDRKFLSLGTDARMLWLFLLTAPSTLPIPGVIVAGPASLAEQLGWSVERFGERFREVQQSGIAVRREGSLVWLCNATKYQRPANPNVVAGWAKCWDDVPECDLKHEIWEVLKVACKSWDRKFAKLFTEPSRNGLANGSCNGLIQEQEQDQKQDQDQDQEQDLEGAPPAALISPQLDAFTAKAEPLVAEARRERAKRDVAGAVSFKPALDAFDASFRRIHNGAKPSWGSRQRGQIAGLVRQHGIDEVTRRIGFLDGIPSTFWPRPPWDLNTFVAHFDKLASPPSKHNGRAEPLAPEDYPQGDVTL